MIRLAFASAFLLALSFCGLNPAYAHDTGQFGQVDPKVRDWFRSQRSPSGVLCCDVADGHRTTWRGSKDGSYEVLIDDEWIPVPPETVIRGRDNPVGEAIVWWGYMNGKLSIRCFVPGDAI